MEESMNTTVDEAIVETFDGDVIEADHSDLKAVGVGAAVATVTTVGIIAAKKFVVDPAVGWFKRRKLKKQAEAEIEAARASMSYEEQVAEIHRDEEFIDD